MVHPLFRGMLEGQEEVEDDRAAGPRKTELEDFTWGPMGEGCGQLPVFLVFKGSYETEWGNI